MAGDFKWKKTEGCLDGFTNNKMSDIIVLQCTQDVYICTGVNNIIYSCTQRKDRNNICADL